jgi:N,N'-diacetyllegionaminate synthase
MIFAAEIGLNHNGNFDLALELIRQAKRAGADYAKFQFGWRGQPDEMNYIDLPRANRLKDYCDSIGIHFFASIFTKEALELARQIAMPYYKIASRTVVDNPELCREILSEGKPTFVSLGMWEKEGFPFGPPDGERLFYIFCRSKYPTLAADLADFPRMFSADGYYGYSDHCLGIEAALLAVARGAQYIEKHFTLNKASQVIRDHALSATPDEFTRLTEHGRALNRLVNVLNG